MSTGEWLNSLKPFWVNFLIYVVVVALIAKKAWPLLFNGYSKEIAHEISIGMEALKKAEEEQSRVSARRVQLPLEKENLVKRFQNEQKLESQHIVESAKLKAESASRQTQQTLESEERAIESEFRKVLLDKVKGYSERFIRQDLTPEIDRNWKVKAAEGVKSVIN